MRAPVVGRLVLPLILALVTAGSAAAEAGRPILDYRKSTLRDAAARSPVADRTRVERAIAADAPPALRQELGTAFVVLGSARGAVSAPGARETVFLVQEKEPVASEPFPKAAAPVLVLLAPDRPARFVRLPADVQYRRLVAAVDLDGDGRSEVLLESSFMNMGELVTSLTAVRLDPASGRAAPIQVLQDVVTDRCDGRRGTLTAATVSSDGAGRLVSRPYRLSCR